MSSLEKSIALLRQLRQALLTNENVYHEAGELIPDITEMLLNETSMMPLLSDKWVDLHRQNTSLTKKLLTGAEDAASLADLLSEAEQMLVRNTADADYYATVENTDGNWHIHYRHKELNQKVIFNDDMYRFFMKKLISRENFALMCNTGEELTLIGEQTSSAIVNSPATFTYAPALGHAINLSLQIEDDNVYFAVPCPCCDTSAWLSYMRLIRNKQNICFSNLWANENLAQFEKDFPKLTRDAIVIANREGEGKPIGNLHILKYFSVPDDPVAFWEEAGTSLISQIAGEFGDRKDLLYVVSAGPASGPIIAELYRNNPDNCYVDFGPAINQYIRNKAIQTTLSGQERSYARACWMPRPEQTPRPEVSVVMTLYKRPETLLKQLDAIERQSLKPKEIFLIQDAIENDVYRILLEENIKKRFTGVKICETNCGVWERFSYAYEASSCDYIAVFDDDTIPGSRWLENCFMHMIQKEGIYVTIGVILQQNSLYPDKNYFRIGWASPAQITAEVDFGGHAWFMKKEHLKTMLETCGDIRTAFKYMGEDMWLSCSNRMHNDIRTVVPQHFSFNTEFWGSDLDLGSTFGSQPQAISMNKQNWNNMMKVTDSIKSHGWPLLHHNRNNYVDFLLSLVKDLGFNTMVAENSTDRMP